MHFGQWPTALHWTDNISKTATGTESVAIPTCSPFGDYCPRFLNLTIFAFYFFKAVDCNGVALSSFPFFSVPDSQFDDRLNVIKSNLGKKIFETYDARVSRISNRLKIQTYCFYLLYFLFTNLFEM